MIKKKSWKWLLCGFASSCLNLKIYPWPTIIFSFFFQSAWFKHLHRTHLYPLFPVKIRLACPTVYWYTSEIYLCHLKTYSKLNFSPFFTIFLLLSLYRYVHYSIKSSNIPGSRPGILVDLFLDSNSWTAFKSCQFHLWNIY